MQMLTKMVIYCMHQSLKCLFATKLIGNEFHSRNAVEHGFIDTDTRRYNTVEHKDRGAKCIFKK